MKKSRILALALVAAITAAGVGYAAWTDTLNVNTTVKTGELSVRFVGPENPNGDVYNADPRMFYSTSNNPWAQQDWNSAVKDDLLSGKVTFGEKTMIFDFANMYPGTRGWGLYTFENDGTIPAVIQGVKVEASTKNAGPDNIAQVLSALRVTHSTVSIVRDGKVADADKTYIDGITINELQGKLNSILKGKRLQPGDKVVLGNWGVDGDGAREDFNFELPLNSLTGDLGEKEEVQINITFDITQHNAYDTTKNGN